MHHTYSVHAIRQPNRNDCWAACGAMLLGLSGQEGVNTVKERARAAGVRTVVFGHNAGGIQPGSVPQLASALGLSLRDCRNESLTGDVLNTVLGRGPAAAFGAINYPGADSSTMHVLMFTGANGPDANPTIRFIDPYTARRFDYPMAEFNEALGSVDYFLYR